jgi:hypothetical protein
VLVGWWLKNRQEFLTDTQLQKFLFFYEVFSKIDNDEYELDGLKGYKRGPVFSAVYTDCKYENNYKQVCLEVFSETKNFVNETRAKLAKFLVKLLGKDLSDFTHVLNIRDSKRDRIETGEYQVPLDESDFSEEDAVKFIEIKEAYPDFYIDDVEIFERGNKVFVISKCEINKLDEKAEDAIDLIVSDTTIESPVYISFDEDGGLLIDEP